MENFQEYRFWMNEDEPEWKKNTHTEREYKHITAEYIGVLNIIYYVWYAFWKYRLFEHFEFDSTEFPVHLINQHSHVHPNALDLAWSDVLLFFLATTRYSPHIRHTCGSKYASELIHTMKSRYIHNPFVRAHCEFLWLSYDYKYIICIDTYLLIINVFFFFYGEFRTIASNFKYLHTLTFLFYISQ